MTTKRTSLLRRKHKIRAKISGTEKRPRVSVFISNKGVFLQAIDDVSGKTLVSSGDQKNGINIEIAKKIAKDFADKAKKAGVKEIVFDRNGKKYHGRVAAIADTLREAGITF